jgi:hypothetical protein
MRKISLLLCGVLLLGLSNIALADDMPPPNSIPMAKVISNIYAKGYDGINKIEYDDGVYKAKVINNTGREQHLYIDPLTGSVPEPKTSSSQINMSTALKNVKDQCKTVTSIEAKSGVFEIECFNSDDKEIKVFVDAISGKISQVSYDD